jgi:hypothetical protein
VTATSDQPFIKRMPRQHLWRVVLIHVLFLLTAHGFCFGSARPIEVAGSAAVSRQAMALEYNALHRTAEVRVKVTASRLGQRSDGAALDLADVHATRMFAPSDAWNSLVPRSVEAFSRRTNNPRDPPAA